ncbi:MAG: SDR family oxidoreductase [Boseongicola sp.]|nr:SDR family oxidoreductase [Boseongicola sp.]
MTSLVYITGATGYVGRHLSKELAACGIQTEPLRLFVDGKVLRLPPGLKLDPNAAVIHLSENPDAGATQSDDATIDAAVHNAKVLSASVAKVIYFSSVAVYDLSEPSSHNENSTKFADTPYANFKRRIEKQLDPEKDLIVRPSNMYGDVAKPNTMLGDLLSSQKSPGGPSLRDPSAQRDFIHLRYVSEFMELALRENLSGVWNLASGIWTSGQDLIDAATGNRPEHADEVQSPYDNRKLLSALGIAKLKSVIDDLLSGQLSGQD